MAGAPPGRRRHDHQRRRRLCQGGARRARGGRLRAELDRRNEKIGYKVREHSLAKVPVLLVVGRREAEQRQVAVRRLGESAQPVLALDECVAALSAEASAPDTAGGTDTPRR